MRGKKRYWIVYHEPGSSQWWVSERSWRDADSAAKAAADCHEQKPEMAYYVVPALTGKRAVQKVASGDFTAAKLR